MKAIETLLKYLNSDNVADFLDDDQKKQIAEDVILGYEIDEDSRAVWLETNKQAMKIIKHCEDDNADGDKDFPFTGSAKVVYPLLAPAVIQMAARMCMHIVQNDTVCKFKVLGPDPDGAKAQKASKMTNYASYHFLIEDQDWLKDSHKLMSVVASWGTGFRQVYYDPITKQAVDELLPPEDVIINHNLSSLDKAKRITIRHWMTKNDLVSYSRSGIFSKLDLEDYEDRSEETENGDSREINPAMEVLCQHVYLDLDEDGYAEPYKVYVLKKDQELLGIYPAFKLKDVDIEQKTGKIRYIKRRLDVVDFHLIDDPEGKFYSIGLNYLLTHQNKAITSILRQLIDSGTLANTQGGFVTKAFKTQQRNLQFRMGQFQVLDINPNVNPQQHIMPLPFKEPSQVLLALLQVLIQGGKETGFITDVLTGDVEGQNTPATTMLAMVEQGTRAFKPVIQKQYSSMKKEFTLWFEINSEYLDVGEAGQKYANFQDQQLEMSRADFDSTSLDICPVADPTQSSEAHKYAKVKFLADLLMNPAAAQTMNVEIVMKTMLEDMQIPNIEAILAPKQQAPDPKMMKLQLDAQKAQMKHDVDTTNSQIKQQHADSEKAKVMLQAAELPIKQQQAQTQQNIMNATIQKNLIDNHLKHAQIHIDAKLEGDKLNAEHRKLGILEKKSGNPSGSTKS